MQPGSQNLDLQLDVGALHARSAAELVSAIRLAKQRLIEAERAQANLQAELLELQAGHVTLTEEKAELSKEKAALTKEKAELSKEKAALTNENHLLLRRVAQLVSQIAEATGRDQQLELSAEISKLQRQLDDRNQSLYGKKSERRRPSDGSKRDKNQKAKKKKRSGATRTRQPKLPIEPVHHELSPEQTTGGCQECGGNLSEMKGQTEDSEEIEVQPIRYKIKKHHRHKYRCSCCGWLTTAPGPTKLVEGGRYSPGFAVQVAIDKYSDALPLARQVARMRRDGLRVTSQTLWDQLQYLYLLLLPTLLVLHARVLQAKVCVADETRWRMMNNHGGGSKKWWLWVVSSGDAVYFQLVTSRGAAAARQLLQNFSGTLVTDDYIVYTSLEKERTRNGGVQTVIDEDGQVVEVPTPDYLLATCWMHARRYLFKAEHYHPEAGPALDLIDELYQIEDEAVDQAKARRDRAGSDASDEDEYLWLLEARRKLRDTRSRRCVAQLDAWRGDVLRLEGTALAEATDHLDRLWDRLLVFLEDPAVPLDSGHAERQVRGPVVGRNNYRGCRSELGARVAALFFSLISTAKNLGLDPRAYLLAAVTKTLREPGAVFTPWDYAEQLAKSAAVDESVALELAAVDESVALELATS